MEENAVTLDSLKQQLQGMSDGGVEPVITEPTQVDQGTGGQPEQQVQPQAEPQAQPQVEGAGGQPEQPAQPQAEPQAQPQGQVEPTVQGAEAPTEGESWQPNYEYQYLGEKREIPEYLRPVVTNAEMEKQVKDLITKNDGFAKVTQDRDLYKNQVDELSKVRDEAYRLASERDYITSLVKKKEVGSVLSALGISNKDVFQYAENLATAAENVGLDNLDQVSARDAELHQLRLQMQQINQQKGLDMVSQTNLELNNEYAKPSMMPIIQQFDAQHGAGAFDRGVRQLGYNYYEQTGKAVPASQLISTFLLDKGITAQQVVQPQTPVAPTQGAVIPQAQPVQNGLGVPAQAQGTPALSVVTPQNKPVIPASGVSAGQTPVKEQVRELKDLENILAEMRNR